MSARFLHLYYIDFVKFICIFFVDFFLCKINLLLKKYSGSSRHCNSHYNIAVAVAVAAVEVSTTTSATTMALAVAVAVVVFCYTLKSLRSENKSPGSDRVNACDVLTCVFVDSTWSNYDSLFVRTVAFPVQVAYWIKEVIAPCGYSVPCQL